MAKKKFLGFIETDPFILFHYIPLIFVIYLAQFTSAYLGLYDLVLRSQFYGSILILLVYYVFLLVGDQLIHKIGGKY